MRSAFATLALAAQVALAGCGYDWTVASGPGDAATEDARALGPDASLGDASPGDAGPAPRDGGAPDAGADCPTLLARADAAREAARRCQLAAGQCTTTVTDACGCAVFVAAGGSAAAATFASASADLARSGCALGCTACPSQPVSGTCLQGAGGTACWP